MISPPFSIDKLLAIMTRLRDPDEGCPWDTQQEFSTIAPYTIEEAYEVAEAIAQNDHDALKDELGDLLFQVVFHAQMAHEENSFDFSDVVDSICDKMLRRHPHVFGDAEAHSEHDQTIAWEAQKEEERAQKDKNGQMASTLDGVAKALPALMRAEKLQKRAARVGFDWPTSDEVFDKINEDIEEIRDVINSTGNYTRLTDEIGDLLFTCVNLARHLSIDAETALRQGNEKFERRFRALENNLQLAEKPPKDCSLKELEEAWIVVKKSEQN